MICFFQSFLARCWPCAALLATLASAAAQPALPQTPPLPPSPVQQFREWLSLSGAERENAVADWQPEKRQVLLAKLKAYEALPASERERRLQMLELRWHLRPLMAMKPEERTDALALVPALLRAIVQERLKHWDSLNPQL